MHLTNVHWGILSTPIIDRNAGLLYACAWISSNGSGDWQSGQHNVFGLDITTGAIKKGALNLETVTYNPGNGRATVDFNSKERKQRSALALVNGALIVCFGSLMETGAGAHGWVIVVDTGQMAGGQRMVLHVAGRGRRHLDVRRRARDPKRWIDLGRHRQRRFRRLV